MLEFSASAPRLQPAAQLAAPHASSLALQMQGRSGLQHQRENILCRYNQQWRLFRGLCSCRQQVQCSANPQIAETLRQTEAVQVTIEKGQRNSRRLYAGVSIRAPVEVVWNALTDYDGLSDFIPGLAENRCLERRATGAKLLQVGEEPLALGLKFRARVVLDIQEHASGIAAGLLGGGGEGRFPQPRSPLPTLPRDISFALLEGDFQAFQGVWRMQSLPLEGSNGNSRGCRLSYALFVRPQLWLPVGLIEGRIGAEVANNLKAVQSHSERVFRS